MAVKKQEDDKQFEQFGQFEQLLQKFTPQSKLLRTWPLKGGISAQTTALEIEQADGQTTKMIVRQHGKRALTQNPHVAENDFKLLQILQSTEIKAQTPHHFDQSGNIFSTPCLLIEYIEGCPDCTPSDLDDYLLQCAKQLAKIHSVDTTDMDLSFLPQQENTYTKALKNRPDSLDESVSEEKIRDFLEGTWPLPQQNNAALLHGDFWPGNILWENNQLAAVIDWEEAALGDPLSDLAISRLDILWAFGIDAMQVFTRHYRSLTKIDFANLPYWDLCAALRPASKLAEWATVYPLFGREDITENTMREGHKFFVAQALETINK